MSEKSLEDLKLSVSIYEYLSANYQAIFQQNGKEFKCLCPLHEEKTASFNVDPELNLFHCFGCNEEGSIVDLFKGLYSLSNGEAIKRVYEYDGKPRELGPQIPGDKTALRRRGRLSPYRCLGRCGPVVEGNHRTCPVYSGQVMF